MQGRIPAFTRQTSTCLVTLRFSGRTRGSAPTVAVYAALADNHFVLRAATDFGGGQAACNK